MQNTGLFSLLPLWAVFIVTLVLVLFSVESGYQWARRKHRAEVEKEAPVGGMVGAMLGLLAFLLAFMFSMTVDRFFDRKLALLNEVNAIRTTYLQAALIPEPHHTEVRKILRNYVDERLRWSGVKLNQPGQPASSADELLDRLWVQTAAVGQNSSEVIAEFVGSVNQVIALHTERIMVRERSHIPGPLWGALYFLATISLGMMGYHCGVAGTARSPVMVVVALGFSLVIILIADIDRPGEGFINVSQQPMIELGDWMDRPVP
jgi:hypothetical protein